MFGKFIWQWIFLQSFWSFVEPMVSDEIKQKLKESLKDASSVRKSRVSNMSVFRRVYIFLWPLHAPPTRHGWGCPSHREKWLVSLKTFRGTLVSWRKSPVVSFLHTSCILPAYLLHTSCILLASYSLCIVSPNHPKNFLLTLAYSLHTLAYSLHTLAYSGHTTHWMLYWEMCITLMQWFSCWKVWCGALLSPVNLSLVNTQVSMATCLVYTSHGLLWLHGHLLHTSYTCACDIVSHLV